MAHTVLRVLCPEIVTYKVMDFERQYVSHSYSCYSSSVLGRERRKTNVHQEMQW